MTNDSIRIRKFSRIIIAYPLVLFAVALSLNLFVFSPGPLTPGLPAPALLWVLGLSGAGLLLNHTWLMTATELTRLRFNMYAMPEEWAENERRPQDVDPVGWTELARHHNAHRNATENSVYFFLLAGTAALSTPNALGVQIWVLGFALARLGYTYGALHARASIRQLCMTLSLLALYGLASGLIVAMAN